MLVIIIVIGIVAILLSIAGNSQANRATLQKMERHMANQLPPPAGFDDCTPEMIAAVREGNELRAVYFYMMALGGGKDPQNLDKAKARIGQLRDALLHGPTIGKPPASVFDHLQGKVGP